MDSSERISPDGELACCQIPRLSHGERLTMDLRPSGDVRHPGYSKRPNASSGRAG
jgi:hypothetical protein